MRALKDIHLDEMDNEDTMSELCRHKSANDL